MLSAIYGIYLTRRKRANFRLTKKISEITQFLFSNNEHVIWHTCKLHIDVGIMLSFIFKQHKQCFDYFSIIVLISYIIATRINANRKEK